MLRAIKTPRPRDWSEATVPTPDQLVRWFKNMTRTEQQTFMQRVTEDAAYGRRCLELDHEGRLEHLERLLREKRMTTPDQNQDTPDATTTHEEVEFAADGGVTHTLDTTEAVGDAADSAVSE